ncbi:MAG: adenylate/guanylate cyclase domain-containing protein [Betaproteobacteria bacterium]|jgi:adenylate cyclase|nr:adenylate/guanylate cyclase domain-containing protein [Betaproteobacteria bacterium]MBK7655060.1 adenylate/guanylate cyclase domain-containing protein [Betaproteobacteria bacterium]MBP6644262.1 adenylate/guanylate cyclase domain-containing protein [Burkholderiaceae bacterium]
MATVVFADLVGSTSLFERLGDETASRFVTQLTGALSQVFEQHDGRVVKLLGDGLFVLFPLESDALAACIAIQKRLVDKPIRPGGAGAPVQMQMGIESGEVVEIAGDCFGDTVNSAARLADLAGADQILTTQNVYSQLPQTQQALLKSIGPMYLRGKAESSHLYRVEWRLGQDDEATMMGVSIVTKASATWLEVSANGETVRLDPRDAKISMGRATDAALTLNDRRVSRTHATVEWSAGQFVLSDTSSFGTWVYLGGQTDAMILRRTKCFLVGNGQIVLGCERTEADAPLIEFSVKS